MFLVFGFQSSVFVSAITIVALFKGLSPKAEADLQKKTATNPSGRNGGRFETCL